MESEEAVFIRTLFQNLPKEKRLKMLEEAYRESFGTFFHLSKIAMGTDRPKDGKYIYTDDIEAIRKRVDAEKEVS